MPTQRGEVTMSVRDLCRTVRVHWQAFRRVVWPADSAELTAAAVDRLTQELGRRYARLLARRRRIERTRDRLARHEQRLALQADSLPLRLAVAHNRDRLARLEETYARHHLAFVRRKKLHKALVSGQVVVCPEPADEDPL